MSERRRVRVTTACVMVVSALMLVSIGFVWWVLEDIAQDNLNLRQQHNTDQATISQLTRDLNQVKSGVTVSGLAAPMSATGIPSMWAVNE